MPYGNILPKGQKGDFGHVATIRHLTRIISYLSSIDRAHQSKIQKETNTNLNIVKGALLFLVNHKLVLKKKDLRRKKSNRWGDMWYYSLSKNEILSHPKGWSI